MVERFVDECKTVWTVKIKDGDFRLFADGRCICYGRAPGSWTCSQVLRHYCGRNFRKVSA